LKRQKYFSLCTLFDSDKEEKPTGPNYRTGKDKLQYSPESPKLIEGDRRLNKPIIILTVRVKTMSYVKRNYRTNLAMQGVVFLDGFEIDCTVSDLSTSGARFEITPGKFFNNIIAFAQTVAIDAIIDVRIPEMHIDGEVKVIRKEVKKGLLYLSVEFSNVFFGLENVPYRRKVYRKKLTSFGHLSINGKTHEIVCTNVSIKGMLLVVLEKIDVDKDTLVEISFNHLGIHGSAKAIWNIQTKKNHTWIGIEYIQLNDPVKGIPTFPIA